MPLLLVHRLRSPHNQISTTERDRHRRCAPQFVVAALAEPARRPRSWSTGSSRATSPPADPPDPLSFFRTACLPILPILPAFTPSALPYAHWPYSSSSTPVASAASPPLPAASAISPTDAAPHALSATAATTSRSNQGTAPVCACCSRQRRQLYQPRP